MHLGTNLGPPTSAHPAPRHTQHTSPVDPHLGTQAHRCAASVLRGADPCGDPAMSKARWHGLRPEASPSATSRLRLCSPPFSQPWANQSVGPRWTAMSGLTFALDCDIYRSPSRGTRARWSASQAATRPFCGLRRGRGRASRRRRGVLRRAWSTLSPGLLLTMRSPSSSRTRVAFSSRWDLPDRSLYSHHTAPTTRSFSSTHPHTHTPSPAAGEESESGGGESATAQGRWYSNEGGGSEGGGGHGGGSVALTLHAAPRHPSPSHPGAA